MASTSLTFTLEGRDRLSKVLDKVGDRAKDAEKKLAMFGAAIPAAAALAPLAAQAGAAGVAVAAFGAAVIPQIGALSDASTAQKKYQQAVQTSGKNSAKAVEAQVALQQTVARMPSATRQAAAALTVLQDTYKGWSDALAKDTMPVFTKGMMVASAAIPKFTPLVKGAAVQLDRLMTLAGGALATPGIDSLMGKFSDFATSSLRQAIDGLVHFSRVLNTGAVGGDFAKFMDYARAQGPLLADTLKNVATAAIHLLTAASGVGVGLLQLANAAAKVVSSLPTGFITTLMQTAIAIRAVVLTHAGVRLLAGAFDIVRARVTAMGTAAIGASTTMGTLRAMFMTFSRTARMTMAATGIGLLALALIKLSSIGKSAPPDVDRLTTALGKLGQTGKVTGEAASKFGTHFEKLKSQMDKVLDPSVAESVNNWGADITNGFLDAGDATEELTGSFKSIDESLASLVRGGKADMAALALKNMLSTMRPDQVEKLKGSLGKYKDALADAKFEQDLTAQSMGLFGTQAQKVQAALDEQKKSADGLRQSIVALNEAHRSAYNAETKFEEAIDAATKSVKDNGRTLDVHTNKGRANRDALSALASATDEAAAASRESTGSWEGAIRIYGQGEKKLIDTAVAAGMTRTAAKKLAEQLLNTPDKTAMLKGDLSDLKTKLAEAKKRLKDAPDSKTAAIKGDIRDLQRKIGQAKADLLGIRGRTVTVQVRTAGIGAAAAAIAGLGGVPGLGGYATGGKPKPGELAWVGENGPELVRFKGGEEVFDHRTSMSMGADIAGTGHAAAAGLAAGMAGSMGSVAAAARTMAATVVTSIKGELQIASPSKKTKALAKDVAKGFLEGLTGSRDKIKSVSKDLANDIKTAFSGKKESNLLKYIDKQTSKLLDAAKKRDAIAAKIAEAKKYASGVTSAARETAGLSNLGMESGEVTAGGIKAGLAGKLAQIKQFTRYIGILAKKGLNKSLLRQILNMGPEQGYAYASALVGADKGTFKSINSMQSQLDKAATTLGKNGADALYDSGKNASKGFLTGLKSQQKDIENLMMKIAKGMQKAIKKALGIKSPSTVMAELGRYSTQGLARGLTDALPAVDQALGVVSGRVAATRPAIGRAAIRGGGSGGTVVHIHVDGAVVDKLGVARAIREALLDLKRTNGGGSLGLA
ncbi:hypothetical protein [Streptomyces sp. NBC_01236]|uniref:hypothetical protein n=1 Tax=Streptomyces sp. NBC_01236 TaxID=2903789 RepID=UPI002E15842A|nr:hypothetical protein OG324_21095 [Streptomyces sp. NBC_01236]